VHINRENRTKEIENDIYTSDDLGHMEDREHKKYKDNIWKSADRGHRIRSLFVLQ